MPIPIKITFTIPMTKNILASEANLREHWTKRHARHNVQQNLIDAYMTRHVHYIYPDLTKLMPCTITLTRISPRALDEDNYLYSQKTIRDALAGHLIPGKAKGRADGDKRLKFKYAQVKGKVREYALKVEIEKII